MLQPQAQSHNKKLTTLPKLQDLEQTLSFNRHLTYSLLYMGMIKYQLCTKPGSMLRQHLMIHETAKSYSLLHNHHIFVVVLSLSQELTKQEFENTI